MGSLSSDKERGKEMRILESIMQLAMTAPVGTDENTPYPYPYIDMPKLEDVWGADYLIDYYAYIISPDIFDPEIRDQYCEAAFFGGNTLRLWNDATDLKKHFLTGSALADGQTVLLVGKFIEESGLLDAVKSLIGAAGEVTTVDTTQKFLDGVRKPKAVLQWDFSFEDRPAKSYDRVILFSTVSQIKNLRDCAAQINRILKDGGRVIIAEDPVGGRELLEAFHMDTHGEAHTFRMMQGMGITERDLPIVGIPEMAGAFKDLIGAGSSSWMGLYDFYGQKGGTVATYVLPIPPSGSALETFLNQKEFKPPFDWMTPKELAAWPKVADPSVRSNCGYSLFLAGGLKLISDLNDREGGTNNLMYDNFTIKKGDKVLLISELLDEMSQVPRFEKRTGAKLSDATVYQYEISPRVRSAATRAKFADQEPQDKGARIIFYYEYPDAYPDDFFDVIWMPQAAGHCINWDDTCARLVRVLKPGGTIMIQEHDIKGPDFWKACTEVSGQFRAIMEKEYLSANFRAIFGDLRGENAPLQPSTTFYGPILKAAFGETLDSKYLFSKGCTTFWGTKIKYQMADWWHAYPYLQKFVPKVAIPGRPTK
jgi:SAM-dependent methyltransferase